MVIRLLNYFKWILILLFLFIFGSAGQIKQSDQTIVIIPRPIKRVQAGEVKVRFKTVAVKNTFTPDKEGIGLERLNLSPDEIKILESFKLAQVRRVKPQLEINDNGKISVLTETDLREKIGRKPLPAEAAKAFVGVERDMILVFHPGFSSEKICEKLKTMPSVESCEPIIKGDKLVPVIPNDPGFTNQWGFNNTALGGPAQAPNFDIDAPEAWEIQKGNPAIVVAVVDEGVDIRHEDLYEKIWINTNELPASFVQQANALSSDGWPDILTFKDLNSSSLGMQSLRAAWNLVNTNEYPYIDGEDLYSAFADGVDNDPPVTSGEIDDIVGWDFTGNDPLPKPNSNAEDHGTAVAGLVGAMTDNGLDIAGVGWNVRIMAVYGDWSWPSIDYAIKHGANIITSSLAPDEDPPQIAALLSTLEDENIVFTAALGNIDKYISGTVYAEKPYVIAVSNFNKNGTRAFGGASSYSVNTEVAGPGNGTYSLSVPSGYASFGGTSGANPIVAGIMSLMVSERAGLKTEQYRQVLRKSAVDIPPVTGDQGENTPGFDYFSGWGLANAKNALTKVHEDPWAEANITTQPASYRSRDRGEEMHIIGQTSDVKVFAGLPAGGQSMVSLDYAAGSPPMASSWTNAYSGNTDYLKDQLLTTLSRNNLSNGINTLRLTVTTGGKNFVDYGRIDVPYAYMDLKDYSLYYQNFNIKGFAFHPQFGRYQLQAASGHGVDESNDALWSPIGADGTQAKEPLPAGSRFVDQDLFNSVSLASLPDGPATLRLAVFNNQNSRVASFSVPVIVGKTTFPFHPGFPVNLGWPYRNGGALAYDLTGDGNPELIVTDQISINVFRSNGSILWTARVPDSDVLASSPAAGDINGDGLPEVVLRSTNYDTNEDSLYVFTNSGTNLAPWPLNIQTKNVNWWIDFPIIDYAPVLADLDADGDLEILIATVPIDGSATAKVNAYQADGSLWAAYGPDNAESVFIPPAIGDMDGDGQLDMAVLTVHSDGIRLSAWRSDGSALMSNPVLDPVQAGQPMGIGMILADMDGDGDLEIIIGANYRLRAFHHDGTPVNGWNNISFPDPYYINALSAADLTPDDGVDDVQIIVSYAKYDRVNRVYVSYGMKAYKNDGTLLPYWDTAHIEQNDIVCLMQPSVFDVDNDGRMEVLMGQVQLSSAPELPYSMVHAFNHDASPVDDNRFPIYLKGDLPRSPFVADLDGNGKLEYGIASNSWGGPVEVFDLDALNDAGAVAWGMQYHDPLRSNNYHGGLRILEPTTTRPQDAGSAIDPQSRTSLLIRLVNELPNGAIDPANLTVKIGGVAAPISTSSKVEGEYWVVVVPPNQAAAGDYKLEVIYNDGGIKRTASQKNAVKYSEAVTPVDQVLVIDKSGSMLDYDKYISERVAANFYVNARSKDDNVGLVSFNTASVDEIPGCLVLGGDSSANRMLIAGKINAITPPGPWARTSIGLGLKTALQNVIPAFQTGRKRAMVLLSDGLENTAPFWDKGVDPVRNLFEQPENTDIIIHTIALGPDVDRDLHEDIAEATGGTARFVYLGSSLSIYSRLSDAYKQVEEIIGKKNRIFTYGEDIPLKATKTYTVKVPADASQASFAICYKQPEAYVGLKVIAPDGTEVNPQNNEFISGPSSKILTVNTPKDGNFEVQVTALKAATEVLTTVSVKSKKELLSTIAWLEPSGQDAMTGTLLSGLNSGNAFIHNEAALSGISAELSMVARVVAPDKTTYDVAMHDDGLHRDGRAKDGIYAAPMNFSKGGGYAITILASLKMGEREAEKIEKTIGYFQPRSRDSDLDGIPDKWEQKYSPGISVADLNPLADHDADGLNTLEEYLYGTDPHNYDTDGDRIPDGVEVDNRLDPLKPDQVKPGDGDRDGDYLPDIWEKKYFPKLDITAVDPKADPDKDELSNYTEYVLGTNPTRADSDGDGIKDDVKASWKLPKPATRTWHPQRPKSSPLQDLLHHWWWALLILVIIILVIVIIIIWYKKKQP
jgi:subtilisin family serine protease/Mg-chelatase subunit ChlD